MKEKDLQAAIQAGEVETLTLYGTPAGWELWASPAPRGTGDRLESYSNRVRVFRSADAGIRLVRSVGWTQTIIVDGIAA